MNKNIVTETADMLCKKAERDIMNVDTLLSSPKYPENLMYDIVCFHVTQAVEKFLKSYIIFNKKTVKKIHDLDMLHKIAMEIDGSFLEIMDSCLSLNEYVKNIKYDDEIIISKQDISDIIKFMQKIIDFPPIKNIRESFSKKFQYEIVNEIKTCPAS